MAIPFNLPVDEPEERRLDQLLLDLYHVLRQILLRNTDEGREGETAPSRSRHDDDVTPRRHRLDSNLPESSTLDCQCLCQSSRRRQRRRRRCCPNQEQSHQSQNSTTSLAQAQVSTRLASSRREDWLMVGEQLRRIAEEFKTASLRKEEYPKQERQDLQLEVKTSGLFSLLVPSHFRHSLLTTVILLVGWRMLVRAR
ncbi:uncharacterized protein LOC128992083 [Macrosteles quadrilineatus]|uniref:uncharacterized protein LOC128992083 n=1 Tax=Macrosteles quadrilineatus TaxID=74068 RepID=UPI0023E26955|nr:uncharacterized protein LOC128992083 [Macrosteles quadrilineatus]